ncbi:hypothetical protein [Nannocystis sp.]|uniref:hypothetical protein n=1 Tax=Nannocystis sp. TaxID=1962667 RepID=UPI0025E9290A|nr:hypothetical protein [Nannocystis sp.]MBK7829657.1 hypothetical protein [Nannocystis sp.]
MSAEPAFRLTSNGTFAMFANDGTRLAEILFNDRIRHRYALLEIFADFIAADQGVERE